MTSLALFKGAGPRSKSTDLPEVPLHIINEDRKRRDRERERRMPQLPLYDYGPDMPEREEPEPKKDGEERGVVIIELSTGRRERK